MSASNVTGTSSSVLGIYVRHHKLVVVGGDEMCGYFAAKEFLKHKGRGEVRVGYMHKESPFIKKLEKMGAEMMQFDLESTQSIKKLFENMECAIISPPIFGPNFHKAKLVVEMAKQAHSLKHVIMTSLMHAEKLKDWDRLNAVYEMEKEFKSSMSKWDVAYILRLTVPLEGFYFVRRIIQEKRELPWPTRDQEVSLVSLCEVAKAMCCLFTKKKPGYLDSDGESESEEDENVNPTSVVQSICDRIASITSVGTDHHHRTFCMTGMEKVTGDALAEKCSRAIGSRIELKAMNSDEFAKCLKDLGELPDEYIKTLKQVAEVISKGMWKEKSEDLHKLLGKKPMTVEKYFERNRNDFKPHN